MTRRDRGMTFLEVMVGMAILAIVATMVFMWLSSATRASANASTISGLEARGLRFTAYVRSELATGKVQGVYLGHTRLRYQVPVAVAPYSTVLTDPPSGSRIYGSRTPNGALPYDVNGYYVLLFVADKVIRETGAALTVPGVPVVETVAYDLNNNGTLTDRFVVGRMVLQLYNGLNVLQNTSPFDDQVILRVDPTDATLWDADMNGDLVADPLFTILNEGSAEVPGLLVPNPQISIVPARKLRVIVWHGEYFETGRKFAIRTNRDTIAFDNPQ